MFSKGFEKIYQCVNKNYKLITNDIVSCYNKIIKNLNKLNLFYIVAKRIIDTSQTYIDKNIILFVWEL